MPQTQPTSRPPRFACIVGAPRCGTTSLAGFLRDHADVCFSAPKEPHFFSQHDLTSLPLPALRKVVEAEYLARYFADGTMERPTLAEGSVSYLYAPEQMAPIVRLWPDARFIIAVRDPLEMLPSLHRRLLYTGDETVGDFERAWRLASQRATGRRVPRSCIEPRLLQYGEIARLGTYVERFFRAVGRERCHVVVFDDLAADPGAVYRDVLAFLDLPAQPRTDFAPQRSSRVNKIGWLQRLLKRPPVATRALLAGEAFRQRIRRLDRGEEDSAAVRSVFALRKRLLRWNRTKAPPVQLSPALAAELRGQLAGEVAHLARLLDRDLSHWLGRAPAPRYAPVAPAPERRPQRADALPAHAEAAS